MSEKTLCPYCGSELVWDYYDDEYDYDDDRNLCRNAEGHCPDCHRNFNWQEHYKFTGFSNVEEFYVAYADFNLTSDSTSDIIDTESEGNTKKPERNEYEEDF